MYVFMCAEPLKEELLDRASFANAPEHLFRVLQREHSRITTTKAMCLQVVRLREAEKFSKFTQEIPQNTSMFSISTGFPWSPL